MRNPSRTIIHTFIIVSALSAAIGAGSLGAQPVLDPITGMIQTQGTGGQTPHALLSNDPANQVSYSTGGGGPESLQARICRVANSLVGKRFAYAPGTKGGRLGCAQVVSTILKAAGAVRRVVLGVLDAIAELHQAGWHETSAPPYHSGDVITWATYSRSGRGRRDPDTHIGILSVEGGTVWAIANSSSRRHPTKFPLAGYPYRICRVLRRDA